MTKKTAIGEKEESYLNDRILILAKVVARTSLCTDFLELIKVLLLSLL